ncbi:MAG: hypothetical protein OXG83_11790 [Acidobacteria bacterium]|nr:hypothetical protein [Acidobacteriota bacterium]
MTTLGDGDAASPAADGPVPDFGPHAEETNTRARAGTVAACLNAPRALATVAWHLFPVVIFFPKEESNRSCAPRFWLSTYW